MTDPLMGLLLGQIIIAELGAGVEMNPENYPQFYNPEDHLSGCTNPDKLFRFCECPRKEMTGDAGGTPPVARRDNPKSNQENTDA